MSCCRARALETGPTSKAIIAQARVLGPQRQAFSGIYKNLQRIFGARMRTAQIWSRRKPKVKQFDADAPVHELNRPTEELIYVT